MDTAKKFKPETILLWERVAEHPEAQRILGLFPSAHVRLVKHQRSPLSSGVSQSRALLAGKRTLMIGQSSSFVGLFDGWLGSNVRCCPYHKLVPVSNGCPYYCTYCYLAFVYRKFAPFIKININYDLMFKQIRKAMRGTAAGKVSFNMGEMLDSLALEHVTNLTTMLVPFFAGFSRGFLMLLTKSANIDNLLGVEASEHTVVSWSLNSQEMIEHCETGTASLNERIEAAMKCQRHGYRIRIRIDPGVLYRNWQAGYAALIQKALTVIEPENITLGMLRLLPGHHRLAVAAYGNRAKKLCGHNFVRGASDSKLRYPPKQRIEFYASLIETIRSFDKNVSISLCRETPEVWSMFKDRCKPGQCNCVTW
ncbi:MAG: SPL family radical SAM protein [Planctomycetota bacterium]|jgi:spore photoproduct lyase